MPPHLLCVSDLTCVELAELLDVAERMKADATGYSGALEGQTLVCFLDPPTTGAAIAADRLGTLPRRELLVGSDGSLDDIARASRFQPLRYSPTPCGTARSGGSPRSPAFR
jgi:hypothetical protein